MARKPAQHRGTGPSSAKNQPRKITIGDGSIRDLVYFLMGGDVDTKRGRKKVSSGDVRNEVQSLVRAQMQGNSPFVPDYAAREAEFDRVVNRNRSMASQPVVREEANIESAVDYFPTNVSGKRMGEFEGAVPLLSQRVYGNRRYDPIPRRNTQIYPIVERKQEPVNENKFNIRPVDQNTGGYTEGMGMMNMGGYVQPKKKKKKKKMYGGKMKKYAKGGGIRKPKYS